MPLLPEKLDLSFPLKPQQPGKGGCSCDMGGLTYLDCLFFFEILEL